MQRADLPAASEGANIIQIQHTRESSNLKLYGPPVSPFIPAIFTCSNSSLRNYLLSD